MKLEVDENGGIILKEVYIGVGLETISNEFLWIRMRDSGFEFVYQGKAYSAQKGVIKEVLQQENTNNEQQDSVTGGIE